MTTCHFPGCDKPVRPVPRARYCSYQHMADAMNLRERDAQRRKRAAAKAQGSERRTIVRPKPAPGLPLPLAAFTDDPKAVADHGSRWMPSAPVSWARGASTLVAA